MSATKHEKPINYSMSKIPIFGMFVLCLTAIIAQSAGLFSVVKFVTSREGWEAQKEQYSAVSSEWESMSAVTQSKLTELSSKQVTAEQEYSRVEEAKKLVSNDLAKLKGEYESFQASANSALELQRIAEAERQVAVDELVKLKSDIALLESKESSLNAGIENSTSNLGDIKNRIETNQVTVDSQSKLLARNQKQVAELEDRLRVSRSGLSKTNDDLIKASNELAIALEAKKSAISDATAAKALNDEIAVMVTRVAKLKGESESLQTQNAEAQKTLSNDLSRIEVAKSKLASYLDKWNSRDKLTAEIDDLNSKVQQLRKTESEAVKSIEGLNNKLITLGAQAKLSEQELADSTSRIAKLKSEERKLLEAIVDLNKLKEKAKDSTDPPESTESNEGKSDE